MAEQMRRHSPYNYAFDNPVRFVDPDGMVSKEWGALWLMRAFAGTSEEEQGEVLWEDGDDKDKGKKKENSGGKDLYLDEISTGMSVLGEGMVYGGEYRLLYLTNQGYRRIGTSFQNYRLTGTNVSLFPSTTVTARTRPFSLLGKIGPYGAHLSRFGTGLSVFALGYDLYQVNQGNLSVSRFGYRLTGFGTSVGIGFVAGGPWGILAGAGFAGGEMAYDETKKINNEVFKYKFDQFYRTLIGGWLGR